MGDGAQEDDSEDGDGQPEGERVRHIPAEPSQTGGKQHHEQDGRPDESRQKQEQKNEGARQDGQLDAAQKDEQDQTAGQGAAETAVRIPLVLQTDQRLRETLNGRHCQADRWADV